MNNLKKVLEELVESIQGGNLTSYSNKMINDAIVQIEELLPKDKKKIHDLHCRLDYGNGVHCNKPTCEGCKDAEDWGYKYDLGDEYYNQALIDCKKALKGE
jgi:uncharacterized protein (DUF2164 family)